MKFILVVYLFLQHGYSWLVKRTDLLNRAFPLPQMEIEKDHSPANWVSRWTHSLDRAGWLGPPLVKHH